MNSKTIPSAWRTFSNNEVRAKKAMMRIGLSILSSTLSTVGGLFGAKKRGSEGGGAFQIVFGSILFKTKPEKPLIYVGGVANFPFNGG